MARIEEHIEIAAPPNFVFRFCHDPAKRPEWDERVARVELLTPGAIRPGTLVRFDARRRGTFLFSWDAEYASFQFPLQSTVQVLDAAPSSPFKTGCETWQFDASGSGTRFTLIWEYKPRHWLASLLDALGQRHATRSAIRRSLANLKRRIEAG